MYPDETAIARVSADHRGEICDVPHPHVRAFGPARSGRDFDDLVRCPPSRRHANNQSGADPKDGMTTRMLSEPPGFPSLSAMFPSRIVSTNHCTEHLSPSGVYCEKGVSCDQRRSSVRYCLSATITLLTLWPWAFLPVCVAVIVLPSAEITTLVVTVGLPSTLPMASNVRSSIRL